MVGQALQPDPREDDLGAGGADIDANADQLDIVALPQPVLVAFVVQGPVIGVVIMIVADIMSPDGDKKALYRPDHAAHGST